MLCPWLCLAATSFRDSRRCLSKPRGCRSKECTPTLFTNTHCLQPAQLHPHPLLPPNRGHDAHASRCLCSFSCGCGCVCSHVLVVLHRFCFFATLSARNGCICPGWSRNGMPRACDWPARHVPFCHAPHIGLSALPSSIAIATSMLLAHTGH